MATVCYLISLFLFRNAAGLAVVTLGLAAMVWLSKVPFGYMVKGLKAILVILIISTLFQLFLTPGETLVAFWKLKITRQGLRNAGFMIVRLTCQYEQPVQLSELNVRLLNRIKGEKHVSERI